MNKKITKAKIALEDIFYNGNLKRYNLSITDAHIAWSVLVGIMNEGKAETISDSVKKFFEKYEFDIKEQGIGWEISA